MNTQAQERPQAGGHRVCPWWMAYLFDNPLRRMTHPPGKVLGPYVSEGMTVLDFGCGFGHYSIGMARLTGETGRVIAADVQEKMLKKTMSRAKKAGLDKIIRPLLCKGAGIGEPLELDFALASNSLHETPDPLAALREIYGLLRPGARLLLMEPPHHVKPGDFEREIILAKEAGFSDTERPVVSRQLCVLLEKPQPRG